MEDITVLFVGDDWAEDHHDVEVQDETGRRLAKARLQEGISGIARLHALVGRFLPEDGDPDGVKIGIETDRGPWVAALVASGYQVYAINPLQSARAREGNGVSGAKSDAGDAHVLADLVRTHCHQLRTVAGDSAGRRGQGPDPDAPEPDLGPNPPGAAAALQPAGVLPSRPGSLRRPRFPRGPGAADQGTRAQQCGPVDAGPDRRRPEAGPSTRPGHQDHRDHGRAANRAPHPAAGYRGRLRRDGPC